MKNNEDDLFFSVRSIIIRSMNQAYHVVNAVLVQTYWHIGKVIVEDEQQGKVKATYGSAVLKNLASQLGEEFGKGYDYTNLTNMRKFYLAFPILDAVRQELSWTHYRLLSRLDSEEKKRFYLSESIANSWNSRTLQRQINSLSFERFLKYHQEHSSDEDIHNLIKDPYIFEFLGLPLDTKNTERDIETAIINHIQQFLLELGKGFAFVARQQHIITDTSDFYIDLVFYNYMLRCFVIIDLKTGNLSHQDIGQIDMYVRMYDDLKRCAHDNPTVGILLCSEKDETIVKYSVLSGAKNIFASKYLLYLPKENELKKLVQENRQRFELDNDQI